MYTFARAITHNGGLESMNGLLITIFESHSLPNGASFLDMQRGISIVRLLDRHVIDVDQMKPNHALTCC
jgi:hypothetical protein